MPTLTFERRPASVICPGVSVRRVQGGRARCDVVALPTWFGLPPSTSSKASVATGTESGCATQVPSKPSPASRSLSARTASKAFQWASSSERLGIIADMPPIAWALRACEVFTTSSE